jgi:hypothetical protein
MNPNVARDLFQKPAMGPDQGQVDLEAVPRQMLNQGGDGTLRAPRLQISENE